MHGQDNGIVFSGCKIFDLRFCVRLGRRHTQALASKREIGTHVLFDI